MRKKISIQFLGITALAIFLTTFLTTMLFYDFFQQEVWDNLRQYAEILVSTGVYSEENFKQDKNKPLENIRITIIEDDGTVAYDNNADIGVMDNHRQRPEIEDAFADGEGWDSRKSATMDKRTFYYAVRLERGAVLRVAKEVGSIWSVFQSELPAVISVGCILFALCMVLTHFLTKSLIRPIEEMAKNVNDMESVDTYKELVPFVNIIRQQHEDIMRNAMIRQDFTANVSHELKTPLTAISGYSELIENGMAQGEEQRFAKEIHRSAKRLLTLINDIIRLSELDAVENETLMEDVNLYEIAKDCITMLQINAENHKVKLTVSGEDAVIHANKGMIEEVLYNLCDNAIRYNYENGLVHVTVKPKADRVILTVADTGIGISEEHQNRVFERFYRVDKSRSKQTGGTGLGLAIVKHIIAKHNAELELESEEENGTTIRITFWS